MALQPLQYERQKYPDFGSSLDRLYNTYLQQRQLQRNDLATGLQFAQAGIDPTQAGIDVPAAASLWGPILERVRAESSQKSQLFGADLQEKQALANWRNAQAEALRRNSGKTPTGYRVTSSGDLEAIPGGPAENKSKQGALETTLSLYETARDGLISGLEGSTTGPIIGRLPAVTASQQIAEGSVAAMAPVLKQLFRVAGEGVFTDRDQALLLNMIPKRTDRPEARKAMIENIDSIVKAKLGMSTRSGVQSQQQTETPDSIRAEYKAGRITKEQARAKIQALGGLNAR